MTESVSPNGPECAHEIIPLYLRHSNHAERKSINVQKR